MTHVRRDGWTEKHDEVLASTVIRFILEGKTRIEAFKEVGKQLNRTTQACGFRWNSTLRSTYEQEVDEAKTAHYKRKRQQTNRPVAVDAPTPPVKEPAFIPTDISYKQLQETFQKSQAENRKLIERNQELEKENSDVKGRIANLFFSL